MSYTYLQEQGGGILGGILLGHTCVCAVEIEPYCRKVLLQRQRDGVLPRFPIWDDVRTFDGKPWRGKVDVVCGGFPCQDISAAGRGAGIEGERSGLWKDFRRVVCEVGPQFVLVENSPILTSRGLGTILGDLVEMGYDSKWGVFSACVTALMTSDSIPLFCLRKNKDGSPEHPLYIPADTIPITFP